MRMDKREDREESKEEKKQFNWPNGFMSLSGALLVRLPFFSFSVTVL